VQVNSTTYLDACLNMITKSYIPTRQIHRWDY